MPDNTPNSMSGSESLVTRLTVVGIGLLVAGVLWLILLTLADRSPESVVSRAERPQAPRSGEPAAEPPEPIGWFDTDMGTGSTEFSAITLNQSTGRLIIADDEGRLFEFDVDEGGLPVLPHRRALRIEVGAGDIEGLAWLEGTRYVVAHENDGTLTIVDIDDDANAVRADELLATIATGVEEIDGNGIEGVAAVDDGFAVVVERPPSLLLIDDGGAATRFGLNIGAPDVSDVWVDGSGAFSVLSARILKESSSSGEISAVICLSPRTLAAARR